MNNCKRLFKLFVFFLVFVPYISYAELPTSINYQGELNNADGTPVNAKVNITFTLYDAADIGTSLWADTQSVNVVDSVFNVRLGSNGNPLSIVHFQNELWLGIAVDTDEEMLPRTALDLVPYAVRALDSDTITGRTVNELDQSAHVTDETNPHNVTATQIGAVTATTLSVHSSNPAAHHSKYTDTEAVSAMGTTGDTNTLNHNRYTDVEAVNAIKASDGASSNLDADLLDGFDSSAFMTSATDNWIDVTGDVMTGSLELPLNGLSVGTDQFVLTNNNIGIGTNTPAYILDVRGAVDSTYLASIRSNNYTASSTTQGLYTLADGRNTGNGNSYASTINVFGGVDNGQAYGNYILAYANGGSQSFGVFVDATGGDTTAREYAFYGVGQSYFSDYVGIGINTPNFTLDVNGEVNTTSGYLINGNPILQSPLDNVFLGMGAGQDNYNSGIETGDSNTFVGSLSGFSNTFGDSNTFAGTKAGYSNLTGEFNTFTGTEAGYSNTGGGTNIFNGHRAGYLNTSGSVNTFVGAQSGYSNTQGSYNAFYGINSGFNNTTAHYNTFIGGLAGSSNTTGAMNTFLGMNSGWANTTGDRNTFAGVMSGYSTTEGDFNIFIGDRAGYSNEIGVNNTYIGAQSGFNNITGNRNIFIGSYSGFEETGSDKLYIHNTGTGTPLIGGDFFSRLLDINGRLHVKRLVNLGASSVNHVAIIENTSTGTSPDVLALKIGTTTSPGASVNFISFRDGNDLSLGSIEGNGSGSVTLAGAGNDYAEYLPRIDEHEEITRGDIVGVFNGKVSKQTYGASRTMVVSSAPIISGNDPGENNRENYSLIAFVGQAEVKVRGKVNAGDYIIPDGEESGVGIAVSSSLINAEQFTLAVGQAWQSSKDIAVKKVKVLVGLQQANPVINKLVAENKRQSDLLEKQGKELAALHDDSKYNQLERQNIKQSEELNTLRTQLMSVMQKVSIFQATRLQAQVSIADSIE